jgi:hypothetical protein
MFHCSLATFLLTYCADLHVWFRFGGRVVRCELCVGLSSPLSFVSGFVDTAGFIALFGLRPALVVLGPSSPCCCALACRRLSR